MKKKVSRLLTAVVSAAMLTGMLPSVICADDIVNDADGAVTADSGVEAVGQSITADVNLTDLITSRPTVSTAADDSTATGQSGAFDGNLTIAFDASDITSSLANLLQETGTDGVTISNPDGNSENSVSAVLQFPDYVNHLEKVSVSDELSSVRADVTTDDSAKTATISFVVKDSDAAKFLSDYQNDQTDLGSGASGNTKKAQDGSSTVKADVITIKVSGDAGSGTSFEALGGVSVSTPDSGVTLTAGGSTVTYSFSGTGAVVEAGEAESEAAPAEQSEAASASSEQSAASLADTTDTAASSVDEGESDSVPVIDDSSTDELAPEDESGDAASETSDNQPQSEAAATYSVKYEFVSGTEGKELPEEVLKLLPTDGGQYASGNNVDALRPLPETVETDEGTWTFKGYDADNKTVADGDVTFTGTWEFSPKQSTASSVASETENAVSSTVSVSESTSSSSNELVPDESDSTASSSVSEPESESTHSSTPAVTHHAVYKFVSGTEGKEIPDEVNAFLPPDDQTYPSGTDVQAVEPSQTTVVTDDGTWTFNGYDAKSKTVADGDVTFTGTWTFETKAESESTSSSTVSEPQSESNSTSSMPSTPSSGAEKYSVFYDFSAQDGTELPVDVMDLLPTDDQKYEVGKEVKAKEPAKTTVAEPEGTWKFLGYDNTSVTVSADGDNTFYGIWKLTPAKTYKVTYKFVSDNSQYKLPDAVTALLPSDGGSYTSGSTVEPKKLSTEAVSVSDGTWKFKGYDKNSATINDTDVTFTGTWTFEKKEVKTYNVHYTFVSGTDGFGIPDDVTALLPSDGNEYESGQEVTAINPTKTTLTVGSWVWTFAGYDKAKKTISDSDITFTGTWTCKKNIDPNETVTLKIVKKWVDNSNAANARPSSISVTLYKNGTKYETFTCKAPTKTADTWTYTLPALPKYENEKEISWTVDEADVQGYSKSIDGMVITNTYGTKVNAAKTGDTSPIGLYVGVAVAALAVVVILLIVGRKKKK